MKTILPFLVLCFIGVTMNAQEFKFVTESIDYGKISQGSEGTRTFEFTNIGDAPLIITGVQSTCGCAIPKKPEKPIMPGEKGQIQVSYDTSRMGGFSKAVTIISNAKQSRKMIKIKGFVSKEKLNKEKV
ncbi:MULTISPECIES: DUF1573 domain-containing protein [unclassified Tenacibaculum]|uniref:DUF1573 domain-containing protein n=1 Tax=unclassified Tenacibaculum TaxID=2635139 RepID=UPI001F1B5940|nr:MULTISPECIES: DUF1573 domain-containing protein [unclassified Tenacibaculum]MCF2874893.1 DUF1573 domain-containing protein [Tenacibaculum sp. Cn5-1]MCF2934041.1 DUF1573 domain-containing protein [Tenacibaculum sp. Cn5-34]MCG7510251.1 DUF1573 domain-containing protein [Tenacibaculum sp. Cn5-46]